MRARISKGMVTPMAILDLGESPLDAAFERLLGEGVGVVGDASNMSSRRLV